MRQTYSFSALVNINSTMSVELPPLSIFTYYKERALWLATLLGISQWENKLLTLLWGPEKLYYTSLWVTGRLICTTALSFWVKLLALQFSHIHVCAAQQETWTDLHHLCVAETVLTVPCCRLMFMTYIFRHCGGLILKIISVQAHINVQRERESVCMHVLSVCVAQTNNLV